MSEKTIKQEKIKKLLTRLFQKIKVKPSIYSPVIEGLIETSLRGVDSHGIRLAPHYIRATLTGRINPDPDFKLKKTSPTTLIVDADHTYGITAGVLAMKEAIKLARASGVGVSVVKNSSHFSAAAIYSLEASRKNMIGLSFTHADPLVVPYGGKRAFLGTNPICFAAPIVGEEPFCLDMATSNIPWNKLMLYKNQNKKLDSGWAVDNDGKPTTDAQKAAALTPIGTYKGYGLGLMIEIFCSLLTGMPFGPNVTHRLPVDGRKRKLGHFFMAIDIKRFQNVDVFKKRLKELVTLLRNQKPAIGFKQVLVAGDPEKMTYKKRLKEGIPLTEEIISDFQTLEKLLRIKIIF